MHPLRIGTTTLEVPPALRGLPAIARDEPAPLGDVAAALRDSVRAPVSGAPLARFTAGRRRICVVLPDGTRPLPVAIVETLLDELSGADCFVRVANGTHRRTTPDEHRRMLGRWFGRIEIGDRSADDPAAHTAISAEARIDTEAARADALVLTGPASFHYLAGFGSGGKLVAPGLADRATAELVHRGCLAPEGGRAPGARAGVLEGNPLRERIARICDAAPPQFYVVPLLDSSGRPTRILSGEHGPLFRELCGALLGGWGVACGRYETVVVSAGGHPYDVDFVQAHKALEAAAAACRPGGTIIFLARCAEGLPARHRAFLEQHPTARAMEGALRARFDIAAHTVWAAREKAERFRIRAVTEMDPAVVAGLGMEPAAGLDQALDGCDLEDAVVIPYGARFLPLAGV